MVVCVLQLVEIMQKRGVPVPECLNVVMVIKSEVMNTQFLKYIYTTWSGAYIILNSPAFVSSGPSLLSRVEYLKRLRGK